ncbi:7alpha-hydroxysteroid dehydrogenase [Catellicoccus marimammalium]|uniref:3-oxoacyl-[acyl-carrier protein] reductase n=1 Tax=Catellicoccus marimammalium M35/04/3 TaxID=1234409 RepID=K8ZMR7_9ENTE|nr:SDR family NAD(P)-dependent oxidoreductase [Catellicoccus marimammalium]EKU27843.1 3-oxoacyl-[acyl-carrier protein] reductase [Catellicoccus marimammalium M35/04/3]
MLENKVAVVTAASRGIGLAISHRLVEEGAIVYMAVRDSEKNRKLVQELHAENDRYRHVIYDAYDFSSYEPMMKEVAEKEGKIDILINNFGHTDTKKDLTLLEGDSEAFFDVVNINLASVYYTCKYAIPYMQEQNQGSIINISSVAGNTPDISRLAYSTSKAAVNSLTKNIAVQYAQNGIRANAILPGLVATDAALNNMSESFLNTFLKHVPLKRVATPDDIANLAVFLASDQSSFITGELIPVAGGFGLPTPIYGDVMEDASRRG